MRTSTAEANGYHYPKCNDEVSRDPSGKGFVRHMNIPGCDFERGQRQAWSDEGPAAGLDSLRPGAPNLGGPT